jgi:HAD superfamily hydrolase (TIGR01509 family)
MPQPPTDLPRPAAVVFDLDGTLVDTVEVRIRAWMAVFDEQGIPADRGHVAELIGLDGRRLAREVADRAGMMLEPRRDDSIDARCGEIFEDLNQRPRALPGVEELIGRLEAAAIPWAIATSSRREQVATSIDALGLRRAPRVVDGSHVAHAKPAPDLLLLAAEELHAPAAACWYVGDSIWDMQAADAAGMIPIGVTTGAVDAATLRAAGARRVFASLAEIEV